MTRMYFDCAIKALYMMREFGVKFDKISGTQIKDLILADLLCTNQVIKAYVAPESEAIFNPKEGDVIQFESWDEKGFHHISAYWISEIDKESGKIYTKNFDKDRQYVANIEFSRNNIIMRCDKQFFTPLTEN